MKINEIVLQEGIISGLKNWNTRKDIKNLYAFEPESWYVLHQYLPRHRLYRVVEKVSSDKKLDQIKLAGHKAIRQWMDNWVKETLNTIWESNKISGQQHQVLTIGTAKFTQQILENVPLDPKGVHLKKAMDSLLAQCLKLTKQPSAEQQREQARLEQERQREKDAADRERDQRHERDMEKMKNARPSSRAGMTPPETRRPTPPDLPRPSRYSDYKLSRPSDWKDRRNIADSKFQKVKRKDED